MPAPVLVIDLAPEPAPVFWRMAAGITRSSAAAPSATLRVAELKVRSIRPVICELVVAASELMISPAVGARR